MRTGDPFKKVHSGERIRTFPAALYNALVDAARQTRTTSLNTGMGRNRQGWPAGIVAVKNDSGGDLDQFSVVGIAGPVIEPADNEDEFCREVLLSGVTPAAASHTGRFLVLLEPLADGAIGIAAATGLAPVLLDVPDWENPVSWSFADVLDGDSSKLTGVAAGAARVIWQDTPGEDDTEAWALVYLGAGVSSPTRFGLVRQYQTDALYMENKVRVEPAADCNGTTTGEDLVYLYVSSPLDPWGGEDDDRIIASFVEDSSVVVYLPFDEADDNGVAGIVVGSDDTHVKLHAWFADCHADADHDVEHAAGQLPYDDGDVWTVLPPEGDGDLLTLAGGLPAWWTPTFVGDHELLDADVHTDTEDVTPAGGELVRGGAGTWGSLAIGAADAVLTSDGGTFAWASRDHELLDADWHTDTEDVTPAGGELVRGGAGTWGSLAIGAADAVLTSDGGTFAWASRDHELLDADWHTDTEDATPAGGELVRGGAGTWGSLAIGAADAVLTSDGGTFAWASRDHELLDADWHTDTEDATPAGGELVRGGAGTWGALGIGADGEILRVATNTPAWETLDLYELNDVADNLDPVEVGYLIATLGGITWDRLAPGNDGELLRMDGAGGFGGTPAWETLDLWELGDVNDALDPTQTGYLIGSFGGVTWDALAPGDNGDVLWVDTGSPDWHALESADLADWSNAVPDDGDVPAWDAVLGEYVPGPGGGAPDTLDDVGDVDYVDGGPFVDDILQYVYGDVWENVAFGTAADTWAAATNLLGLHPDFTAPGGINEGDVMIWRGASSALVNESLDDLIDDWAGITNLLGLHPDFTAPGGINEGDVMIWRGASSALVNESLTTLVEAIIASYDFTSIVIAALASASLTDIGDVIGTPAGGDVPQFQSGSNKWECTETAVETVNGTDYALILA